MPALLEPPTATTDTCTVSAWMFFRSLKASKLFSADDIGDLERRSQGEPLQEIIDSLLDTGALNDYQLQQICEGNPGSLVFGQYHVTGTLGSGGCGDVYMARHRLMQRTVALKVINAELSRNRFARDVFLREVIASTRLSHPNIATAYDANEHDGQLYFVMEFVSGTTLHSHVSEHGPITYPMACTILLEAAHALQHAHEMGLVHRDIKPANLMLPGIGSSHSGSVPVLVKIVDFGLARILQADHGGMTTIPCAEGGLIGTPAFIAPEQIRDSHCADIRSDLYSLGCTLYFALTGQQPFNGLTPEIMIHQHLHEAPKPLRSFRASIPPGLARIIERLMAKDPAQRPQTPADLIAEVNPFILSGELHSSGTMANAAPRVLMDEPATSSVVTLDVAAPPPSEFERQMLRRDLTALWDEWSMAVAAVTTGAPSLAAADYKVLYRRLLETAERLRSDPADALAVRIHTVVEPWVSVAALAKLEDHTRNGLLDACRSLDEEVSPQPVTETAVPWHWGLAAMGLFAAGLAFAMR